MTGFSYADGQLHADGVPLSEIAESVGTPAYVYSATAIRDKYRQIEAAFAPLNPSLHYAVKACSNLNILRMLRDLGSGLDIVSGGELERAWIAGVPMERVVFAGVGKTDDELRAALDGRYSAMRDDAARFGLSDPASRGPVGLINFESLSELKAISRVGRELGVRAQTCIRINPDIKPDTHAYTATGGSESKFGINYKFVPQLFDEWADDPGVQIVGLHVHIGSPIPNPETMAKAVVALLDLVEEVEKRGHKIEVLDLGGGLPACYRDNQFPEFEAYGRLVVPLLKERADQGTRILLEPGRSLMANSGIYLTRVQHIKEASDKTFVICDGGMQSLIRPALYSAFHFIWPVAWEGGMPEWTERPDVEGLSPADIVGPICETGDFMALKRPFPKVTKGDLIAVFSAGAYGIAMASNYNTYGRPPEVLVDGNTATVIAERQSLASVFEPEKTTRPLARQPVAVSNRPPLT